MQERLRTLGELAVLTTGDMASGTSVSPVRAGDLCSDAQSLTRCAAEDAEAVVRDMRAALKEIDAGEDFGTADLLAGMIREHEKAIWMLRSHLA